MSEGASIVMTAGNQQGCSIGNNNLKGVASQLCRDRACKHTRQLLASTKPA